MGGTQHCKGLTVRDRGNKSGKFGVGNSGSFLACRPLKLTGESRGAFGQKCSVGAVSSLNGKNSSGIRGGGKREIINWGGI